MSSAKVKKVRRKQMKKLKRVGLVALCFFIFGFIVSFLIHNGLWSKLTKGFGVIPFYIYPLLVIFIFFIVILVHELGHLLSFVVSKVKIRALLVLGLVFKRTKKGFKFEFFTPLIKLLGGLVVPELPNVGDDDEYNTLVEKFSKALIAGPMISLYYFIFITVIFIFIWVYSNNSILIGIFALNFIVTFILTILIMLSSKVHTNILYGDFVAYDKMKNDELFQLNQITQYMSFKLEEDSETNEYLINKIKNYIKDNSIKYNMFTMNLYSQYISLILHSDVNHYDSKVDEKIRAYQIKRLINNDFGIELAYLISAYYYRFKKVDDAYMTFNRILEIDNKKTDSKEVLLLNLRYAHLLNIKDNTLELIKEENLYTDELYLLKPIFALEDLREEATFKLPFVDYYTELYCDL